MRSTAALPGVWLAVAVVGLSDLQHALAADRPEPVRLVLRGVVTAIEPNEASTISGRRWQIVLRVEGVDVGEYSEPEFRFDVHDAVGKGFFVGRRCSIGAVWRNGKRFVNEVNLFEDGTKPIVSLPCIPAKRGDPKQWNHTARVLSSFSPDNPRPKFLGAFDGGANGEYELHIWHDAKGIFGQLLYPVLDADSPTARLRDVQFDINSGALEFTARFGPEELKFAGRLRDRTFRGTVARDGAPERVTLRKLRPGHGHGAPDASSYTSRDQFECAMTLYGR